MRREAARRLDAAERFFAGDVWLSADARGGGTARACTIAARTRCGATGVSKTAAPSGRSASLTALTIAAGGPMAPFSPMPFMPKAENGDGVSMKSSLTVGIDVALGAV